VLDSPKPVREVEIPAGETHAYSLEEEVRMLAILPEPAATVVAMATFTGARKGEIRGFQVYYPNATARPNGRDQGVSRQSRGSLATDRDSSWIELFAQVAANGQIK
jgi:hypothetical protein